MNAVIIHPYTDDKIVFSNKTCTVILHEVLLEANPIHNMEH